MWSPVSRRPARCPVRTSSWSGANGSTAGIDRIVKGTQLVTTGNVPAYPSFVTLAQFHDRLQRLETRSGRTLLRLACRDHHRATTSQTFKTRYVDGPIAESFDVRLLSRTEHPDDFDLQFDGYPVEDLET